MVKGISRQVIVVHSPDPKMFEQAIFILKEDAIGREGITDEVLLQEAKRLINGSKHSKKRPLSAYGIVWAISGAICTGIVWLLTALV